MNVSATIKTVLCAEGIPAHFHELSYDYTDGGNRLPSEKSALKRVLGGTFAMFPYPAEFGKDHLALWRRMGRLVVAVQHELGGLQSLRDEEIGAVMEDIERNRPRFLPHPDDMLRRYLTTNEDIDAPTTETAARDALEGIERVVGLERVRRIRQVVLRHGRPFVAQSLPPGFVRSELGTCHADAILECYPKVDPGVMEVPEAR